MTYQQPVDARETPHRIAILSLRDLHDAPSLHAILVAVSNFTKISVTEMLSPRRQQRLVDARFLYFAISRQITTKSFPQISREVNKDHSTAVNGCHRVRAQKRKFLPKIAAVLEMLGQGTEQNQTVHKNLKVEDGLKVRERSESSGRIITPEGVPFQ